MDLKLFRNFIGQGPVGEQVEIMKVDRFRKRFVFQPAKGNGTDVTAGAVFIYYLGTIIRTRNDPGQLGFIGQYIPFHGSTTDLCAKRFTGVIDITRAA